MGKARTRNLYRRPCWDQAAFGGKDPQQQVSTWANEGISPFATSCQRWVTWPSCRDGAIAGDHLVMCERGAF